MSHMRLVAVRKLFNSVRWNSSSSSIFSAMTYHTDSAEPLLSNVDTSSPDYKVAANLHSHVMRQASCKRRALCV